jgi:hypothetical protein
MMLFSRMQNSDIAKLHIAEMPFLPKNLYKLTHKIAVSRCQLTAELTLTIPHSNHQTD